MAYFHWSVPDPVTHFGLLQSNRTKLFPTTIHHRSLPSREPSAFHDATQSLLEFLACDGLVPWWVMAGRSSSLKSDQRGFIFDGPFIIYLFFAEVEFIFLETA